MKRLILILFLLAFAIPSRSQQSITDSLLLGLEQASADLQKLRALERLATHYEDIDPDISIEYSKRRLELAEAVGNRLEQGQALIKLANSYSYIKADYTNGLKYYIKAQEVYSSINNKKGVAGATYGMGTVYVRLKNYPNAVSSIQKARDLYTEVKDTTGIAMCYSLLGSVYHSQGDLPEALENLQLFLDLSIKMQNEEHVGIAYANLGNIALQMGDADKALRDFDNALSIFRKTGNTYGVITAYLGIAETHRSSRNFEKAIEYYSTTTREAEAISARELISQAYSGLAATYEEMGDHKMALDYQKKLGMLKDTIYSTESTRQLGEMQAKYEAGKKQQEIELLTKDRERQAVIRNALIAGVILILVMAFLIYNRYRIRTQANKKLETAYRIIEEKNQDITDSINYAQRIQTAILPPIESIRAFHPESFVLYKPKDIVSGDFYWFAEKDGCSVIAAADCTGHGVPGAFMSMIGNTLLHEIILEKQVIKPADILFNLREGIIRSLNRAGAPTGSRDGMDIVLCTIHRHDRVVEFAGANRPLYIIQKEAAEKQPVLTEIKGDKQPIGSYTGQPVPFQGHRLQLSEGDMLYMLSDGYADQFGGPNGKKFMTRNLKELLTLIHDKEVTMQQQMLEQAFESWKGPHEQIDDILVIGIRI
jgi:serine phosphatase RsbU (regulator of sigma subunit)